MALPAETADHPEVFEQTPAEGPMKYASATGRVPFAN